MQDRTEPLSCECKLDEIFEDTHLEVNKQFMQFYKRLQDSQEVHKSQCIQLKTTLKEK